MTWQLSEILQNLGEDAPGHDAAIHSQSPSNRILVGNFGELNDMVNTLPESLSSRRTDVHKSTITAYRSHYE